MLSGAFRAALHRVLTCAILSQEYQGKTAHDLFCAMLSEASRSTLHRVFTCAMLPQEC